jgi:hypothetical protein
VKRIEVDPSDVRVVGAAGPAPTRRDSRFGLRLKIAAVIAAVEIIAVAVGGVRPLLMMLVAVAAVAFHLFVGRRAPTVIREISWVLAISQAMVALFIAAIGTALFVLGIVVVLGLIIAMMMILGERR